MRTLYRRVVSLCIVATVFAAAAVTACTDVINPVGRRLTAGATARTFRYPRDSNPCKTPSYSVQPESSPYGINVNGLSGAGAVSGATYESIAERLRQANVGRVRLEFNWGAILGRDSVARDTANLQWGDVGCSVDRVVSRGMNVLGMLENSPPWTTQRPALASVPGDIRPRYTPDDIEDWKRFVQAAVANFPDVRYWSIWNEPNGPAFLGDNPGDDAAAGDYLRIAAYNRLVAAAAPIIHASGGHVVGLELAIGINDPGLHQQDWLQGVLGPGGQGQNIDVVAVHSYAGRASDTKLVMESLVQNSGVSNWHWPVWLTEVGLIGCTDSTGGRKAGAEQYCVGPNGSGQGIYLNDDSLAAHVAGVLSATQHDQAAPFWVKSFYWHAYDEFANAAQDWGILRGAASNMLSGRPAYTRYASIAGPLGVRASRYYVVNDNVDVTATPAVAAPASAPYYYEWEYTWCANTGQSIDCDGQWYAYASGPDATISPYVDQGDTYMTVRVRQYAWQGGPQIGEGGVLIRGAGTPCPPRIICDGGGGGMAGANAASAGTTEGDSAPGARPAPRVQVTSAERRKGRGHAGNR